MDYNETKLKDAIKRTKILKMPRAYIATFGSTAFNYYLCTAAGEKKTRIREGTLFFNKPLVIVPGRMRDMIEGFNDKLTDFAERIFTKYGADTKLIGYQFRHTPRETWVEAGPMFETAVNFRKTTQDNKGIGIIIGDEKHWEVAAFKFMLKLVENSLRINISDLMERGFFDRKGIAPQLRQDIERLFAAAGKDKHKRHILGQLLQDHNIFDEYEERFFKLFEAKSRNK